MTKAELKEKMEEIYGNGDYDPEGAHCNLDDLLLEYIDDEEITEIFKKFTLWYA